MSQTVKNYSLRLLMILFIGSLSVQKMGVSSQIFKLLDWTSLLSSLSVLGMALYIKKDKFKIYFEWIDLAYFAFLLSVGISYFVNPGQGIFYYFRAFVLNYLMLSLAARNIPEDLNPKFFLTTAISVYLPLMAIHLYYNPAIFSSEAYQGVFHNPNVLGVYALTPAVIALGLFFSKITKEKYLAAVFYFLLITLFSYLVIISRSRTAVMALFLSVILALVIYIKTFLDNVDKRQRAFLSFLIFLSIPLLYLILKDSAIALVIKENVIDKFAYQLGKSRLLSGRERIWKYYLASSHLFKSEMRAVRNLISLSPHNAFIEVISRFGQVAGFFYLSYWLLTLKNLVTYTINKIGKDGYLPFYIMAIISFVSAGTMEIVTYHPLMYLAMYASSRILLKNTNKDEKSMTLSDIKSKIRS